MQEDAIQVAVRIRPLNKKEMSAEPNQCRATEVHGNTVSIYRNADRYDGDKKTFTFDHCFGEENASPLQEKEAKNVQLEIYKVVGEKLVKNAFDGFNCCIFAYGQTGSGKTHTMLGNANSEEDKGLIPRICEALVQQVQDQQEVQLNQESEEHAKSCVRMLYSLHVSYCEIYMEKVYDLLHDGNNTKNQNTLRVREDPVHGPFVQGLVTKHVNSYQEIDIEIQRGLKNRTVAATNMNQESSRSHAIFTIAFTQTTIDSSNLLAVDKTSKISLIDLAGSERATSTGAKGTRLKEASMINKSLSTLGRVISTLSSSNNDKVPYRDSTLTWLLRQSLGGNSKTTMLAMISPSLTNVEESTSTLRYAESAKKVMNKAVVNEDPNAKIVRQLQEEIEELRNALSSVQEKQFTNARNSAISSSLIMRQELLHDLEASQAKHAINLLDNVPSLVNLNENVSVSKGESLVYYLTEGINVLGSRPPTTSQEWVSMCNAKQQNSDNEIDATNKSTGKVDWVALHTLITSNSSNFNAIRIIGSELEGVHAVVVNIDGKINIHRACNGPIQINGMQHEKCTTLGHRDRIHFGSNAYFRVHVPSTATASSPVLSDDCEYPDAVDMEDITLEENDAEKLSSNPENALDASTLEQLLIEANNLCDELNFGYRLELMQENNDSAELLVSIVLDSGKLSSVSWSAEVFMNRLQTLRNLSVLQHESEQNNKAQSSRRSSRASSSGVVLDDTQNCDPFFEVRSSAVRSMGQACFFLDGLENLQELKHLNLPLLSDNGDHVGTILLTVSYEKDAIQASRVPSFLSPRSASSLVTRKYGITFVDVKFTSGYISNECHLTYRRWDEKQCCSTHKGTALNSSSFSFDYACDMAVRQPRQLDEESTRPYVLIEAWGTGSMEPIPNCLELQSLRKSFLENLPNNNGTHHTEGSASRNNTSVPENDLNKQRQSRRRSSIQLSAKLDVFMSLDFEERQEDGTFRNVSIKEDGTLRLRQNKERRLLLRVTQADHDTFCLGNILQVRICLLGKVRAPSTKHGQQRYADALQESQSMATIGLETNWETLHIDSQSIDDRTRTISSVLTFGSNSSVQDSSTIKEKLCRNGERQIYRVTLAFETAKSTLPVIISKLVDTKMYENLKNLRSKIVDAWWARDSYSRTQHLGNWFSIEVAKDTDSSDTIPQTITDNHDPSTTCTLLDSHASGLARRDAILQLDRKRQSILHLLDLRDCSKQDIFERLRREHPIYIVGNDLYLQSHLVPTLYMHIVRGIVLDCNEHNDTQSIPKHLAESHIVTQPDSIASLNNNQMCGYLMIRDSSIVSPLIPSRLSIGWTRRWCVLQRPVLRYYKSFSKKKEIETIDVSRCQLSVHASDTTAGIPYSFHLSTSSSTWHFQASNAAETRAWLVSIDPLLIEARDAVTNQPFKTTAPIA